VIVHRFSGGSKTPPHYGKCCHKKNRLREVIIMKLTLVYRIPEVQVGGEICAGNSQANGSMKVICMLKKSK